MKKIAFNSRALLIAKLRLKTKTVKMSVFFTPLCMANANILKRWTNSQELLLLFSAIFIIWGENHPLNANVLSFFGEKMGFFEKK